MAFRILSRRTQDFMELVKRRQSILQNIAGESQIMRGAGCSFSSDLDPQNIKNVSVKDVDLADVCKPTDLGRLRTSAWLHRTSTPHYAPAAQMADTTFYSPMASSSGSARLRGFSSNTSAPIDENLKDGQDAVDTEEGGTRMGHASPTGGAEEGGTRKVKASSVPEHIGYRVVETLPGQTVELRIQPQAAFAVVQVGSHQFKVTPGDAIYVEKLLHAGVNDKVALEKVLLLGSETTTIIGRPIVPGAHVTALLEEHALDAKVIIFKKKRRKNYRRTNGHRQELTRLRILQVNGLPDIASEHIDNDIAMAA